MRYFGGPFDGEEHDDPNMPNPEKVSIGEVVDGAYVSAFYERDPFGRLTYRGPTDPSVDA